MPKSVADRKFEPSLAIHGRTIMRSTDKTDYRLLERAVHLGLAAFGIALS